MSPDACSVARRPLEPRHATFTRVCGEPGNRDAQPVDEVIATWFPAPHSYTGEHIVEISTHGSPVILQPSCGARLPRVRDWRGQASSRSARS